ncbi:adenylate cyclase [Danaus plexippus plexippus]|uniref:Adenylate cyclase n=1 Tax=Danaus plexippus plexippus TaxID=278856 RepID=A0A212EU83_DANPL|nr:adenylate cyclase [Danaus plexippus plexippus]
MAESLELYTKPEETPLNETKDPDLHQKYEEKSFTEKLRDLKKNITVEPMLAGFVIPSVISKFAMGYFNLYKVCRINFEYPEDICNPSGYSSTNYTSVNATAYERDVQKVQRDVKAKVSFFAVSNVADTIKVAFRKRPSNRRMKVILTLIAVLVLYGPSMCAMTCITIFSKKLQIDDALLCLISIASKFVGSVWTAFAKANWEIYMIPVAEIFTGTTFTSLRSIMSKLIDQDETAKVNSLFSLTETLASLIFQPFYSWLYMNTLQAMSGAVFLTSASLIVPASFILTVFYILSQRELSKARRNAHEEEEKKKFCKNTPA